MIDKKSLEMIERVDIAVNRVQVDVIIITQITCKVCRAENNICGIMNKNVVYHIVCMTL